MELLPSHLKKYIVEQNYEKYTPIDHAVWRYILKQLKDFLSTHAHECYVSGLEKTGISVDEIPKISDISQKIEKFGWRALPVSGFIPPAAFMEMQSLGVLPIASDMRSIGHLMYTPAPDIVHEAAGHAPILIHPEFSAYLKQYAQVARKAIISKEDLAIYEAIRVLSDLKENPDSTPEQIAKAEKNLAELTKNVSHISEAAELSRMNWWTAEYGLIGNLQQPKIFGAGLLSSVGESKWCLGDKVKKIPLNLDCIKTSYDITEPQPQLFVAKDFKHLQEVLELMANQMAFRKGGKSSLDKAIQAQSVNTIELNSNLQISGVLKKYFLNQIGDISYLQFEGPSQLCLNDQEIPGHSKSYHSSGYGTALGQHDLDVQDFIKKNPHKTTDLRNDIQKVHFEKPIHINLNFKDSFISVEGDLVSALVQIDSNQNRKVILISFSNCTVKNQNEILFQASWGIYDMAVGQSVPSVFGGAADRASYGETDDFVVAKVPTPHYLPEQIELHQLYQRVRNLRKSISSNLTIRQKQELELTDIFKTAQNKFSREWLLFLEIYELSHEFKFQIENETYENLKKLSQLKEFSGLIDEGLRLYA